VGSIEVVLTKMVGAQMAQFYNLPYLTGGADGDANCLDEQNGIEKIMTLLGGLISETDITINLGMFGSAFTVSFEQLVIDNEMGGMLFRLLRGIDVTPETLAIDLIDKVGPEGQYLAEMHTLEFLRKGEHWEPQIFNRGSYENWQREGSLNIIEKAKKKADEIIQSHKPQNLKENIQAKLNDTIRNFEKKVSSAI
jgi:trimethylamine--corrinoid protein Co-methyltransferase